MTSKNEGTTWVVALYLPYTIDFENGCTPGMSGSRSPVDVPISIPDNAPLSVKPLTLFDTGAPPPMPNYSLNTDPFSAAVAKQDAKTDERQTRPTIPRTLTLARTEISAGDWGRSRKLNQPKAKVGDVPPSTILQYAKARDTSEEEALQELKKIQAKQQNRQRSKSRSRYDRATWAVQPALQGNGALTNAIKAAAEHGNLEHITWVGTLGFPTDQMHQERMTEINDKLEIEYDSLPVWVKDKDFDGHYNHYSHTILWPIFHYQVPDHPKSKAFEDHSWKYYVRVNEAFANRIIKSYKHGDTIWIHDYHLMLVPGLIRKKIPDARIGFFLHTAFPSSEVFRCLPTRKELLEGVLGANLVVFQADEYAHHFLTTCGRLLVVEATEEGVQLETHFVNVTHVPMGIVPDQLQDARQELDVKDWIDTLAEKYKDKRVIVGRDKVDNIRGIKQKLLSFEIFLKENPDWVEDVVLIQVATSAEVDKDVERGITEVVNRIDAKFSTLAHQPLQYLKQDIAHSQYLALMSFADILMLTPLRDGMNLTGHEFTVCQDGKGTEGTTAKDKKHGPMILSEFTGSATVLNGAMRVNPWDYRQCARAIKTSLEMDDAERDRRFESALEAVVRFNGETWVEELRGRLASAYEGHQSRGIMNVPRLATNTVMKQYKESETRLFILDYEGTLAAWTQPSQAIVANPQRVIDIMINLMTASDRNIVYVTSGRAKDELEHIFRGVPGIGLIAENGCFVRRFTPEFGASPQEWQDLVDSEQCDSWKPDIVNILKYYQERIESSWIEERACSVIYHYDGAEKELDAEAISRHAGECANHINDSCNDMRVKGVPIDNSVVVELMDHNKMTAAAWVLQHENKRLGGDPSTSNTHRDSAVGLNNSPVETLTTLPIMSKSQQANDYSPTSPPGPPVNYSQASYFEPSASTQAPSDTEEQNSCVVVDFLFVSGDNRDDEGMFRWANSLGTEKKIKNVNSVYVGNRPTTEATSTITQGVTGLLTVLQKLSSL